jgi:arylsulfatase A-like enzyme
LPANHQLPEGAPDALRPPYPSFRGYAYEKWGERQWRLHRWTYARLTDRVDAQIGIVLRALRDAGLEDNTLIVFTSDHGDLDGAHRLEHKSFFYEEAARVPFIVSWKGVTKVGSVDRSHTVSSGLDVIPTLCDFAGIQPPDGLHGRSLRALAEGRVPSHWREGVVSEMKQGRMVCSGRYKYSVYATGQQREFLVDLQTDPGEMKNLAGDPAESTELDRHRDLLDRWVRETDDRLAKPYTIASTVETEAK